MDSVTGTLVWYYYVCKREVWLMAHELNPEEDNPFIEIGRILHKDAYQREKKEITVGNMKLDIIKKADGQTIVAEIKKSLSFELPARMQLAFYLYRLKEMGIMSNGELLVPKERKRRVVKLDEGTEKELKNAMSEIEKIISKESPPEPEKSRFCRKCGYREFCWA